VARLWGVDLYPDHQREQAFLKTLGGLMASRQAPTLTSQPYRQGTCANWLRGGCIANRGYCYVAAYTGRVTVLTRGNACPSEHVREPTFARQPPPMSPLLADPRP